MADEKKDKELKKLTKELLNNQIKNAEQFIQQAQQQIANLQNQIQQNLGVAGLAKHYLENFDIADGEPQKPELEVK